MSLRFRLMGIMLALAVIPVATVTWYAANNTQNSVEDEIISANTSRMLWSKQYLESELDGMHSLFDSLQIDAQFRSNFSNFSNENYAMQLQAQNNLFSVLSKAFFYTYYTLGIIYLYAQLDSVQLGLFVVHLPNKLLGEDNAVRVIDTFVNSLEILQKKLARIDKHIAEYVKQMDQNDASDWFTDGMFINKASAESKLSQKAPNSTCKPTSSKDVYAVKDMPYAYNATVKVTMQVTDSKSKAITGRMRPAAALKAGGQGMRYTVCICGQQRYMWLEDRCKWFVEAGDEIH